MNKHLFLYPELLSRLVFSSSSDGTYLVRATTSQKPRKALPEEIIRQIFILSLIHHYHYPEQFLRVEHTVFIGRSRKRADIVVLDDEESVQLVIEVKQILDTDSLGQLASYVMATGAKAGALITGNEQHCYKREGGKLIEIDDLPLFNQQMAVINTKDSSIDSHQATQSQLQIPIENFERISDRKTRMKINGIFVTLLNENACELSKVKKELLKYGSFLDPNIKPIDWHESMKEFFKTHAYEPSIKEPLLASECLTFLVDYIVENKETTELGQSVNNLIVLSHENRKECPEAQALRLHGMLLEEDYLLVANNHAELKYIFRNTRWSLGWRNTLKQIKGAKSSSTSKSFPIARGPRKRVISRCTAIPLSAILK